MVHFRKPSAVIAAESKRVEQKAQAFKLKKAGVGFREIGTALGISTGTAHNLVHEVMDELAAEAIDYAKHYREEQWQRLEDLVIVLQAKAKKGDIQAIEKMVKILERQAALRGLDAPKKIAETDTMGNDLDIDAKAALRARLLRRPTDE